jgi:hypothetical protein
MCSNNNRTDRVFSKEFSNTKYYYNPQTSLVSNKSNQQLKQHIKKSSPEQTFYAKLINVNQPSQVDRSLSRASNLQRRQCIRNANQAYPTAGNSSNSRLTDNYLNSKLAEYLNEADYEALMNFDSVLETVTVPKVESPSASSTYSTSSSKMTGPDDQLNYSHEDDDFQKYYELEKFHSSLKKNIQKSAAASTNGTPSELNAKVGKSQQFQIVGNKRLDSNSVGSFSSSSASSISSQSSAANSSTTSSSSSSPLLSANFLNENNAAIYSNNFKIRNRKHKANTERIASPVPALPTSQPPSLTPNKAPVTAAL